MKDGFIDVPEEKEQWLGGAPEQSKDAITDAIFEKFDIDSSIIDKELTTSFINKIYVIEDLDASQYKKHEFRDLDEAFDLYKELPSDRKKSLGIDGKTGALDFIQCVDGADKQIKDYEKLSSWNNQEIKDMADAIKAKLYEERVRCVVSQCDSVMELQNNRELAEIEL